MTVAVASPLLRMVTTTLTDCWNDSCSIEELTYAIQYGAVGATSDPQIVVMVLNYGAPVYASRASLKWARMACRAPSESRARMASQTP